MPSQDTWYTEQPDFTPWFHKMWRHELEKLRREDQTDDRHLNKK